MEESKIAMLTTIHKHTHTQSYSLVVNGFIVVAHCQLPVCLSVSQNEHTRYNLDKIPLGLPGYQAELPGPFVHICLQMYKLIQKHPPNSTECQHYHHTHNTAEHLHTTFPPSLSGCHHSPLFFLCTLDHC